MKLKLISMLPAAISLGFALTPIIVTAGSKPGQMFIAQTAPDATPDATSEPTPRARSGPYNNLNLTDDQKDKIRQIKEQENQQIQALITPDQETKIQQIKQDSDNQINGVLTDEQRQELQQSQSSEPRQFQPSSN